MKVRSGAKARSGRDQFTFHGNLAGTRHGWLRLTPAYSVHLVRDVLGRIDAEKGPVLDPFCGTGTTLLACAERGLDGATLDVNPFLVWLARAKVARYDARALDAAGKLVLEMTSAAKARSGRAFVPGIHRIDRWWDAPAQGALGRAAAVLHGRREGGAAWDLAALALCRALLAVANVSFGHQSMSFRRPEGEARPGGRRVSGALETAWASLAPAAATALPKGRRRVWLGDSRNITATIEGRFGAVITSPPYANRMSYIRELRPYMYWLGHLRERSEAGELDWRAIGGTWGAATSRLGSWKARAATRIPFDGFDAIVRRIGQEEPLLGSYVHRYFEDMATHVASVRRAVAPGGTVHYVVGNSKFYDVVVPAEQIFAALFEAAGFRQVRVTTLRKRTSKKELFEYLVEGTAR